MSEVSIRVLNQETSKVLARVKSGEEITLTEHDRIVDLIAAHDRDGATAMMRDHLERATSLYAFNDETANRPDR